MLEVTCAVFLTKQTTFAHRKFWPATEVTRESTTKVIKCEEEGPTCATKGQYCTVHAVQM